MKTIPRPRSPQSDGCKAISYAYASSSLAAQLGAAKTGCHVVETPDTYAGPFATWKDAKAHADTLPGPFSKYSATQTEARPRIAAHLRAMQKATHTDNDPRTDSRRRLALLVMRKPARALTHHAARIARLAPKAARGHCFTAWTYDDTDKTKRTTAALEVLNEILGGYGTEELTKPDRIYPCYAYVNTGDTYSPTIIHRLSDDSLSCGTWGDIVERWPTA